jgi:peptidoglycan/xylan/chitin deacetylase (PgdA/CDA1 family)
MPADLAADLAALEAADARASAHHEFIPRIAWPEGVRMAVNVTLDFDAMLLRRLMNEPPSQLGKGEFGGRVGIWRMIALFDSLGIKSTVFTPGRIVELYPEALRHAHAGGHEIADHMWEHHVPKDPELERDHLRKAIAAIEGITGRRPVGTRSWHTQALLQEEGIIYNSHGHAHHLPHYHRDAGTGQALLNIPFHYVIDDAMFYSFAWLGSANPAQRISDSDRVAEMWWEAFWQQYQQGGYLNIVMHPFVSGRALRVAMMEKLLRRMQAMPGVWFPTMEELARHVIAAHPAKGA